MTDDLVNATHAEPPIDLLTYQKEKYGEQIVAVKCKGSSHLRLFDACEFFMETDTWGERQRVSLQAKIFAEVFVSQMNGSASLSARILELEAQLKEAHIAGFNEGIEAAVASCAFYMRLPKFTTQSPNSKRPHHDTR